MNFYRLGQDKVGRNRSFGSVRSVSFERNCNIYAEGSCLVSFGNTKVLCTATVEDKVPPFLRDKGQGWLTAEYSLLPRSTAVRVPRDITKGKLNGRSSEIQRLIGRALRSAVRLDEIGERTILIDCDVIQADGGTRTAAITGGFVALFDALRKLKDQSGLERLPVKSMVAAVSVGKVDGYLLTDLCYDEDSIADVDMNVVMDSLGNFIEIQGTGEGGTFSRQEMDSLVDLAENAIAQLMSMQYEALEVSDQEAQSFDAGHKIHSNSQR